MFEHNVALETLSSQDCDDLLQFELENKAYFEQFVPPRKEGLLTDAGMARAVDILIGEMIAGSGAYYLLWQGDAVIGRFNFTLVGENVADLGYRLAQNQTGRGVATYGLGLALDEMKSRLKPTKIIAETTPDNVGSIRVMKKCGFVQTGIKHGVVELLGQKVDLLEFELELNFHSRLCETE